MRKYLPVAILATLAAGLAVAVAASQPGRASSEGAAVTSVFKVEGMTCGGCEAGVKIEAKKLDGVTHVEASYQEGRAEVTYDPEKVTPEEIIEAIEKLGYKAELETAQESAASGPRVSILAGLLGRLRCC